ncbi:MAG: hypothetical protein M3066_09255 [Actinomycetota bacterium]|nr:hypothetical protein [Actinomycetota bacterium]
MAELPELWTERTPERLDPRDRAATTGLGPDADAIPDPPAIPIGKDRRERGPFLTYLCLPWSYGDRTRGERWHRLQCRRRRHQVDGGHVMQVGGAAVFVARRCRWCGHEPGT